MPRAGAISSADRPLSFSRCIAVFGSALLFWHFDRQRNVVRVFLDDVAQPPAIGKFIFRSLEVQDDARTALSLLDGSDFEITFAFG